MSAPTQFTQLPLWNGVPSGPAVPAANVLSTGDLAEVKDLLRQIRDLQQAHFQRYLEFTGQIITAEKGREKDAERLLYDQYRYQEELRKSAFNRQLISWAVWGGLVLLLMGGMFLFQFLSPFGF